VCLFIVLLYFVLFAKMGNSPVGKKGYTEVFTLLRKFLLKVKTFLAIFTSSLV